MRKRYWLSEVVMNNDLSGAIPRAFLALEDAHEAKLKQGDESLVGQIGDVASGS